MSNVNLHTRRNPGGYGEITMPEGKGSEHDTYTCCHCNHVVIVKPDASNVGEWCSMCGQLACQSKGCSPALNGCGPFEKKLEAYEARTALQHYFQNQIDKAELWARTMAEVKLRV